jgi:hypothetical protein
MYALAFPNLSRRLTLAFLSALAVTKIYPGEVGYSQGERDEPQKGCNDQVILDHEFLQLKRSSLKAASSPNCKGDRANKKQNEGSPTERDD